jgi:dihydrofolate synthase/folylpolyglutamate synthase
VILSVEDEPSRRLESNLTHGLTGRGQYANAISFLYGRIDFERMPIMPYRSVDLKLSRMRRLLQLLGNPHRKLRIVHVAGTKGKGSTCAMIASVLHQAGYKTGVYTSPHLHCLEERFVVANRPCTESQLTDLVRRIQPAVERLDDDLDKKDGPTFFEITTAIALLHFADQDVDFAVLEVGLGGRLDSTNVCHPMVAVITSISYDHMKQLGNTLAEIAFEKAGIIKPNVPVVSGVVHPEARDVIRRIANERSSELWERDADFTMQYLANGDLTLRPRGNYQSSINRGDPLRLEAIELGLLGEHQLRNAAVAIAVCESLQKSGVRIDAEHIRFGLRQAYCPARIELVSESPAIVVDAAHNGASMQAMIKSVQSFLSRKPRILVFATTQGKDIAAMLCEILHEFDHIIFTKYLKNPRGVDPEVLAAAAHELALSCDVEIRPSPDTAVTRGQQLAGESGFLCITGSFFIAAEVREILGCVAPATVDKGE